MACGDPSAAFRVAVLDPELTRLASRGASPPPPATTRSRTRSSRRDHAGATPLSASSPARPSGCSRATSSGCSTRLPTSRRAAAMLLGRAPGRRGHRGLDARRHPRLREPALRALRHRPRRRHRAAAAARRALERAAAAAALYAELLRAAGRDPGPDPAGRLARPPGGAGRPRGTAARAARGRRRRGRPARRWPITPPSSGRAASTRGPSTREGALELYREAY